jgi:hypothetical protein
MAAPQTSVKQDFRREMQVTEAEGRLDRPWRSTCVNPAELVAGDSGFPGCRCAVQHDAMKAEANSGRPLA